ncbi:uncharacterized protein LOC124668359 [Lolium rigidum]|uniref:uncharacterized protein LOC124668359 n=1 Tax=Lolium rigidum TaxID=89674 RepID=UPI001F5DC884|nr:uncharacterized protein LOC124668359 [Lolium rigidum]
MQPLIGAGCSLISPRHGTEMLAHQQESLQLLFDGVECDVCVKKTTTKISRRKENQYRAEDLSYLIFHDLNDIRPSPEVQAHVNPSVKIALKFHLCILSQKTKLHFCI